MRQLPTEQFHAIVAATPLVSLDLVIVDPGNAVLLGLRNNPPARDFWFVPGGRIYKDERLVEAFSRLCQTELGHAFPYEKARPLGLFEHHYPDSVAGECITTHYLAYGLLLRMELDLADLPQAQQHRGWRWFDRGTALADATVHPFTKDYLRSASTD